MNLLGLFRKQRRLGEFLDQFVGGPLTPILAGIGRPPAVRIESFATGQNALVRRLVLADGQSLVLRAYFVDAERQDGTTHAWLTRHLAGRGFRVPQTLFHQVLPFPRGKADVEVLLEEFIEGEVLTEKLRDNAVVRRAVVETLVRLHADRAPQPGRPWLGRRAADPMREALEKAPARFDRVRKQLGDVNPADVARCTAWLREQVARRPVPESYELVHSDCNRENLILTPDGRIAVVDLVSMAYGCFEADLVDVRWMFFDEAWWREFCEGYFAAEPARRERFETNAPLFFAVFFLTKASRQASSAGRAHEKGDREAFEMHRAKSRKFWERLVEMVEKG